jgi:Family of unknown function (DUF5906)
MTEHPYLADFIRFESVDVSAYTVPLDPAEIARYTWPITTVAMFLRTHVAYVKGTNAYLLKVYDHEHGRYRHELRSHRECVTLLAKHSFPLPADPRGKPVREYRGSEFLDSRDILVYENVVFVPHRPGVSSLPGSTGHFRTFNLFTGFRFGPVGPCSAPIEEAAPFFEHAREVLCGGDLELYDYLMAWLGHLVQFPAQKPGTALLFVSEPGAGKNIFFDIVRDVIGARHVMLVNRAERVMSKFNAHLATKLLVVMDEARFDRNGEDGAGVMKSLITQSDTVLEKKFSDAVSVKSYERYVLLSNERFPVRVDRGDRRYCCFSVSGVRVGDAGYFNRLARHYASAPALNAVYSALLEWPGVPGVLPVPPMTALKRRLIDEGMSPEARFIRDELLGQTGFITPALAMTQFQAWCSHADVDPGKTSMGRLGAAMACAFGAKKRIVMGGSCCTGGGVAECRHYGYTMDD